MQLQTQVSQPNLKLAKVVQQLSNIVPLFGRTINYVEVKIDEQLNRRALVYKCDKSWSLQRNY